MNQRYLVVLCVMLSGCTQGSNPYSYGYYSGRQLESKDKETRPVTVTSSVKPEARIESPGGVHIVNKGETLYSIAFMYGQDVRDVAKWNGISAPYTIYPKQAVRISPPAAGQTSVSTPTVTASTTKPPAIVVKPLPPTTTPIASASTPTDDAKISWQWPTNGKIIGNYSESDTGKKGMDIAGQTGQPVYAAADGRVVYSGNSLRGYGNLIILKHNETFYSAYAHNERLLVTDDQQVKKGQRIADMGSSGTDKVMLHFEVRRDGKPVDPQQYLPKRR